MEIRQHTCCSLSHQLNFCSWWHSIRRGTLIKQGKKTIHNTDNYNKSVKLKLKCYNITVYIFSKASSLHSLSQRAGERNTSRNTKINEGQLFWPGCWLVMISLSALALPFANTYCKQQSRGLWAKPLQPPLVKQYLTASQLSGVSNCQYKTAHLCVYMHR